MALRTEHNEIGGMKVTVTTFPTREGLEVKARLIKLVAPSLFTAIQNVKSPTGAGKDVLDMDIDLGMIREAVNVLADRLDAKDFVKLVLDMMRYTFIDGKKVDEITLDAEFAGEYETLYKVLWMVIKVNRFFGNRSIGNLLPGQPIQKTQG